MRICEIYSKLTIKTPEQRRRRHSYIFIVNLEQISRIDFNLKYMGTLFRSILIQLCG